MKHVLTILCSCLLGMPALYALNATKTVTFDFDWKFQRYGKQFDGSNTREPGDNAPAQPGFNDSTWRKLDLPHDWGMDTPFVKSEPNETGKLLWNGVGWYRKEFEVDAKSKGNRLYLDFDGVMMEPKVYVNGKFAGEWAYGYNGFRVDITDFVKFGEKNLVAVRAQNLPESTRWYPGAGIYRHVWITESNPVHIAHWGVFVHTPQIDGVKPKGKGFVASSAQVMTETTITNTTNQTAPIKVLQEVLLNGRPVAKGASAVGRLAAGQKETVKVPLVVRNPMLWDINQPALYTLRTRVVSGRTMIDLKETTFGIRKIEWKLDGFYLNERKVKIQGVCMHHDLGALGTAVHQKGYERQIKILQSFGTNAIRGSHNPMAPEMMEAADRAGMLFAPELFDIWKFQKYGKYNGYHKYWEKWHEKDLINFVHRDRNHPSVICWFAGNEITEQGKGADGIAVAKRLLDLFHREDPTRLVTIGCNDAGAANNGFGDVFDIYGFNYKPWMYKGYVNKKKPFWASETSSCVSSRGKYFFPEAAKFWDKGAGHHQFHVSSYDLYAPGWAYRPDIEFAAQDDCPEVAGEFVWTGFDYIGEPTPYNQDSSQENNFVNLPKAERERMMAMMKEMGARAPSRSSYFGIVDLCGFWKDRTYSYQAQWMPHVPMVHILPHWNWVPVHVGKGTERIGKVTPIHVYTSGDSAELFINGKSMGKKSKGKGERDRYRLCWEDVKFEPGRVEVVAYKDGKEWAKDRVETTGLANRIKLEADRQKILGDGRDLSYITISLHDNKGRFVPTATGNLLKIKVTGPIEIAGVCNGDQTDHNAFKGTDEILAFSGMAQVVLRSKRGEKGNATITITSEGLAPARLPLQVFPATQEQIMTNR